jgi:hypothetical protein
VNEKQYKIVKIFLDGFKVPVKRLAREWGIDIELVTRVHLSPNFQVFRDNDTPYEDMMRTMGL